MIRLQTSLVGKQKNYNKKQSIQRFTFNRYQQRCCTKTQSYSTKQGVGAAKYLLKVAGGWRTCCCQQELLKSNTNYGISHYTEK